MGSQIPRTVSIKDRLHEIREHLQECSNHALCSEVPAVYANESFEIFLNNIKRKCLIKKKIEKDGYITLSYI